MFPVEEAKYPARDQGLRYFPENSSRNRISQIFDILKLGAKTISQIRGTLWKRNDFEKFQGLAKPEANFFVKIFILQLTRREGSSHKIFILFNVSGALLMNSL